MNFKTKLQNAIEYHKTMTGETITTAYVAAQLWPMSNIKTQRVSLSQLNKRGLNQVDKIMKLKTIFPNTDMSVWIKN